MKKVLITLLVVLLVLTTVLAFACKSETKAGVEEYTIVSPDGAPALAIAPFIGAEDNGSSYRFVPSIVSSTLIKAEAVKADFAIVPANMAAILYNQGAEYKMVASVTNGNMFLVSNQEGLIGWGDMKGHMLYSIGQGSIPAFILLNILNKLGIDWVESETPVEGKVAIQYVADGQALIAKFATATDRVFGNLAEPAVSTALVANNKGYVLYDLQSVWRAATGSSISGYAQAVLIAKKSICEEKPEVVEAVLNTIKDNETYILDNAEVVRQKILEIYPESSLKKPLTREIAINCNVKVHKASENIDYILTTLNAAYAIKAQSVGGSVPAADSGFYY